MNASHPSLDARLQELRTLRDEIRLQLHLAGQEARERWERHLEPYVAHIEAQLRHLGETTTESIREAIDRATAAFREFRGQLGPAADTEPDFTRVPPPGSKSH